MYVCAHVEKSLKSCTAPFCKGHFLLIMNLNGSRKTCYIAEVRMD